MDERDRLLADLRGLKAHHEFTRDRIGQPGCRVRETAAEHVEMIERALVALQPPVQIVDGGRCRSCGCPR